MCGQPSWLVFAATSAALGSSSASASVIVSLRTSRFLDAAAGWITADVGLRTRGAADEGNPAPVEG